MSNKTIEIKLVKTQSPFHDFDVSGAGTIRRVTISPDIKLGDTFNIFFGDGHYVPKQKEGATWLGKTGYSLADVEKSIRRSSVFIGESMDSAKFYARVAKKYCACGCKEPYLKDRKHGNVIAVDLEQPDYSRSSSRNIVYLSECGRCGKELTHGTGIGSFCTVGEVELMALAEKQAGCSIDFGAIVTSTSQLK
jgi:hypothetical protein